MTEEQLRFSSYHLKLDPERHLAAYGARLLWDEVIAGSGGVVGDRQDAWGDRTALKDLVFPVVNRWTQLVRERASAYALNSGSNEAIELREGPILVVGSPQGSYGYLYVTAVFEKETA